MTTIYKKDTGRLKVAEAKRLIVEAMPDDEPGYVAFSCAVDADGNERWDFDNPKHQTYRETVQRRLNNSFLDLCQKAGFEPHLSIDPSTKGYRLREADDHLYMVTHAQFVKLAEAFSLTVVVGDEPDATPAPVVPNEIDFAMLATRTELIDAFGKFTNMDKTWFNNLTDSPKLIAARKYMGQSGRKSAEPLFCPYEVMQWLTDPKRRKGKSLSEATAWRLLKSHFPKVYNQYSIGDPTAD